MPRWHASLEHDEGTCPAAHRRDLPRVDDVIVSRSAPQ